MLNHIDIMGRLVRDPELRYTNNQTPVTSFTLAVDDDYTPKGEQKKTTFIDCVAWRQSAEFIKNYFTKGSMAVVSGRLQFREWEKEGVKHRNAEVLVENIYFGASKSSGSTAEPKTQVEFTDEDDDLGDLPFQEVQR